MTDLERLGSRILRLGDPALKPLRSRVAMALGTGVLPPPHTGRRYHAVGEDMILRSGFAVNPSATEVLAVLDGPTSHEAQRLPASLVLLSGSGAAEKAGQGPQKLAHALVRSVRQAQPVSVFKFSDFWRSHAFSCEAAGEQVKAGRLGRALDRLLRQVDERYAEDPLDAGILQACEAEGIALNEFLDRLLTWRTVWFSPYTGRPVLPEVAAEICKTMHAHWQENSVPGHCYGAQYWNHPSIRATFSGKGEMSAFMKPSPKRLLPPGPVEGAFCPGPEERIPVSKPNVQAGTFRFSG